MIRKLCPRPAFVHQYSAFKVSLSNVCICFVTSPVSPFLVGQALWVASRFTKLMSEELLSR